MVPDVPRVSVAAVNIPDPYKVLQVDPEAEDEVIEAAYRRLAKKYHPDVAPGPDAQDRMVRINQAWEMLRSRRRRAAVDRARARSAGAAARVAAAEGRARAAPTARAARQQPAPAAHATAYGRPAAATHGIPGGVPPSWGFPGMTDPGDAGLPPRAPSSSRPNWTTGRSHERAGYDPGTMGTPQGDGAIGPPPGNPSGSVLNFGRYAGLVAGRDRAHATSSTSSGSTGCRSAGPTRRRSTGSCAHTGGARRRPTDQSAQRGPLPPPLRAQAAARAAASASCLGPRH